MKRIEYIRNMPIEKIAKAIVTRQVVYDFCDGSCNNDEECEHEMECCIKWLNQEIDGQSEAITEGGEAVG